MSYVVTAPYVTVKVRQPGGAFVVNEFYKDAPIPDAAEPENVARLLAKGMLAEVGGPAPEPEPALEDDTKPAKASKATTAKAGG